MAAPVYVLEGAWEKTLEAPQVLPYLLAYAHLIQCARPWHGEALAISERLESPHDKPQ